MIESSMAIIWNKTANLKIKNTGKGANVHLWNILGLVSLQMDDKWMNIDELIRGEIYRHEP